MTKDQKKSIINTLEFPIFDTKNGILEMFQGVGFEIKRVFVIRDMKGEDVRGAHAHHKTQQILIAINGGCLVDLDDGEKKETIELDKFNRGVLLKPYVWHVMRSFKPNTILLALASSEYEESDYIRNYDDFIFFKKRNESSF